MKKYRVTIEDVVYQVSVEPIREDAEDAVDPDVQTAAAPIPASRAAASPCPPASGLGVAKAFDHTSASGARPAALPPARPAALPTHPAAPPAPKAASGRKITASLPGNMWKVKAAENQRVKRGDILFIIEAMKMENEIFAPCDGLVTSVSVTEGAVVSTGDILCEIR